MQKVNKISFTGDILCDYPEFKYMKKNGYYFNSLFNNINLKDSEEILVGNLETPICDYLPYTFEPYSFNTPSKFLGVLKENGFDILSIANNHCLDRGILGAIATINNIKKNDMECVGIYHCKEKNYNIINLNGIKIAFVSFTYGTNYSHNHCFNNEKKIKVNLLKSQLYENSKKYSNLEYYLYNLTIFLKNTRIGLFLRKIKNGKFYLDNTKAYIKDDLNDKEWKIDNDRMNYLIETIHNARSEADSIVILLHSGGQFNKEIGSFTKKIIDEITKLDIDLIIGNHPHIVQKFELINNVPVFYSLGNFIFSPISSYVNKTNKPEYSIKVNTYWKDNKISYIKYEILKVIVSENFGHSSVINTFDLSKKLDAEAKKELLKDCNFIINLINNTNGIVYLKYFKKEYTLLEEGGIICQE